MRHSKFSYHRIFGFQEDFGKKYYTLSLWQSWPFDLNNLNKHLFPSPWMVHMKFGIGEPKFTFDHLNMFFLYETLHQGLLLSVSKDVIKTVSLHIIVSMKLSLRFRKMKN